MQVGRLDPASSRDLLERMLGAERVATEGASVAQLMKFCDGLPIALRICATRLMMNRTRSVAWLVGLLEDEAVRLHELSGLDAVFNQAYRGLTADEQRLYRRLGDFPGRSFTPDVAAVASGMPPAQAERLLERLVAVQLVEREVERHRFHDLLRLHACARADEEEPRAERDEEARRVVQFYVHATRAVDFAIIPRRLRVLAPPEDEPPLRVTFRDDRAAFTWFDAERQNLLAVLRAAADRGLDLEVCRICEALWPCYTNAKPYAEWIEAHRLAVAAARRLRDAPAEARLRSTLARGLTEAGDFAGADRELVAATRAAERSGHAVLQASVLDFRGQLELALADATEPPRRRSNKAATRTRRPVSNAASRSGTITSVSHALRRETIAARSTPTVLPLRRSTARKTSSSSAAP